MGSSCSKRDLSQSRQALTRARTKKDRHTTSSPTWFEKCSITVEAWSTAAKRVLPKKSSSLSGCKYVIIVRIAVEKKQMVPGEAANKPESKHSCVLRMPSLDWGKVPIILQFPRLMPLNLWPGEKYVYGFTTSENNASDVTLVGKVGNENVSISQPVIYNPNFSTERWKRIGCLLEAEMKKHNTILMKASSRYETQKRDSRDTGYTSTSYKYSSDASQKPQSAPMDQSSESGEEVDMELEMRKCRRKDTPSHSPVKRSVQKSYKQRVEESKLVEERESSSKSTDDSKSPSSTEKTSLLSKRSRRSKRNKSSSSEDSEGERSDTKDLGYKHGDYSSNLTGSLSNINLAAEESSPLITGANNVGTDREVTSSPGKADSPEAQKQKTKLKKKRLAAFQKASIVTLPFTTDDTVSSTKQQMTTGALHDVAQVVEDKVERTDGDDADDESGEMDKGALLLDALGLDIGNGMSTTQRNAQSTSPKPYSEERTRKSRPSFSALMEKQDSNPAITSPRRQKFYTTVALKDLEHPDATLSPKSKYFAVHEYGLEEVTNINNSNIENKVLDQVRNTSNGNDETSEKEAVQESGQSLFYSEERTGMPGKKEKKRSRTLTPVDQASQVDKVSTSFILDSPATELSITKTKEKTKTSTDGNESDLVDLGQGISAVGESTRARTPEVFAGDSSDSDKDIPTDNHTQCNHIRGDGEKMESDCKMGKGDHGMTKLNSTNLDKNATSHTVDQRGDNKNYTKNSVDNKEERDDVSSDRNIRAQRGVPAETNKAPITKKIGLQRADSYVDTQARPRAQSFGGSRLKSASCAQSKKHLLRHSVESTDPRQSMRQMTKAVVSPVREVEIVQSTMVAFVAKQNVEDEQETPEQIAGAALFSARKSTRKAPNSEASGRKLTKFYKQTSKNVSK